MEFARMIILGISSNAQSGAEASRARRRTKSWEQQGDCSDNGEAKPTEQSAISSNLTGIEGSLGPSVGYDDNNAHNLQERLG